MKKIAFMVLLAVLMAAGNVSAKTEAELVSQFNELIPPDKIPEPTVFCNVPAGAVVNPGWLGTWCGTNTAWGTTMAFVIKEVMKEGVKKLWVFRGWDDRPYPSGKGTMEVPGVMSEDGTRLTWTSITGRDIYMVLDVKGRRLKFVYNNGREFERTWLYPVPIQLGAANPTTPATAVAK